MDGCVGDGWMEGRSDVRVNRWIIGWTDGYVDVWIEGLMVGWLG